MRCLHSSIMILISHISLVAFFDNFSPFIIQHPFVGCFLKTSSFIFVHLLPLNQSVVAPDSSMSFGLIHLITFLMVSLFYELPLSDGSRIHIAHTSMHISSHLLHHFVSLLEHPTSSSKTGVLEKRVVFEWI